MGDGEVAVELRDLLCGPLVDGRHVDITDRFDALGLTEPELEPGTSRSKAERVRVMLAALPEQDLRRVAEAVLHIGRVSLELRNRIQDILWQGRGPAITERTRRAIAAALDIEDLVIDSVRFETMLDRWWVLGELGPFEHIFAENDRSTLAWAFGPNSTEGVLRKQIRKHVFNNLGDWTTEKLFDELGTFIAVDRRFAGFIEDLSSHQAVIHEENQRRIVSAMDPVLRDANLELRVTGTDGGYPVFGLMSTGSPHARPKSVIFGSIHKPDLRVSDTVNHDLEIHDDRGNLVFDDPIGPSGLSWSDLQTWWQLDFRFGVQCPCLPGSCLGLIFFADAFSYSQLRGISSGENQFGELGTLLVVNEGLSNVGSSTHFFHGERQSCPGELGDCFPDTFFTFGGSAIAAFNGFNRPPPLGPSH